MTDEAGQEALRDCAQRLVTCLRTCSLGPVGDAEHMQHREFAERARLLGMYLDEAMRASERTSYPPAFALVRSGLEHHVMDKLLFLATRHAQVRREVTEEHWQALQANRPARVVEWKWEPNKRNPSIGTVHIVWRGLSLGEDPEQTLSIYYAFLRDYNALATHARHLDFVVDGTPSGGEEMRKYAEQQQELYAHAFRWVSLKDALLLNELADERTVLQLDVHYRFLSAFVHPLNERSPTTCTSRCTTGSGPPRSTTPRSSCSSTSAFSRSTS